MNLTRRAVATLWLAGVLQACGGSAPFVPVELPITRIAANWRVSDLQQTYTVRTAAEWRSAWEANEPQTIPRADLPQVDFSQSMVVGLTLGSGPNGCHSLAIVRVVEEADVIRVEYRRRPGPTELPVSCTLAVVALTDFVSIKKSDKRVTFIAAGV